jgi:hypothetical protein
MGDGVAAAPVQVVDGGLSLEQFNDRLVAFGAFLPADGWTTR